MKVTKHQKNRTGKRRKVLPRHLGKVPVLTKTDPTDVIYIFTGLQEIGCKEED